MARITQEIPNQEEILTLIKDAETYTASLDAMATDQGRFFVAREGKTLVGYAATIVGGDREAEIKSLFVVPPARGKGVGKALMKGIVDGSRREGIRWLRFQLDKAREPAIALCRGARFKDSEPFGKYTADANSVFLEFAP